MISLANFIENNTLEKDSFNILRFFQKINNFIFKNFNFDKF